jgi:hypothetical protein
VIKRKKPSFKVPDPHTDTSIERIHFVLFDTDTRDPFQKALDFAPRGRGAFKLTRVAPVMQDHME